MPETEAEQTNNGDYRFIGYHVYEAVDYDRLMSWTAGFGKIGVGVREITFQKTDAAKEEELLPAGRSVVVIDTKFKLIRKA